jgi:hypothetical protein
MSANAVLDPPEELIAEEKSPQIYEPKLKPVAPRKLSLLEEIFKGHQEFLGLTPD